MQVPQRPHSSLTRGNANSIRSFVLPKDAAVGEERETFQECVAHIHAADRPVEIADDQQTLTRIPPSIPGEAIILSFIIAIFGLFPEVFYKDIHPDQDEQDGQKKGSDGVDLHLEILRDEEDQADGSDDPTTEVPDLLDQGAESNDDQKHRPALGEGPDTHLAQDDQDPKSDQDHASCQDTPLASLLIHDALTSSWIRHPSFPGR